jgi:hypothetical protein
MGGLTSKENVSKRGDLPSETLRVGNYAQEEWKNVLRAKMIHLQFRVKRYK